MVKQLKKGGNRLKTAYWSLVGMASVALISLQPVMADTIWDRFSKIMKDVYGQLVGISTIVAVTAAAIALIIRYLRMHAAGSGMQYAERRPWSASRYMKTGSPFMMVKASVPYQWKLCGINRRRPALRSRSRGRIREVSLRGGKDNGQQKAGLGKPIRLSCFFKENTLRYSSLI